MILQLNDFLFPCSSVLSISVHIFCRVVQWQIASIKDTAPLFGIKSSSQVASCPSPVAISLRVIIVFSLGHKMLLRLRHTQNFADCHIELRQITNTKCCWSAYKA